VSAKAGVTTNEIPRTATDPSFDFMMPSGNDPARFRWYQLDGLSPDVEAHVDFRLIRDQQISN